MAKQATKKFGNKRKGSRVAKHKASGKYAKQRIRTTRNKAKRMAYEANHKRKP